MSSEDGLERAAQPAAASDAGEARAAPGDCLSCRVTGTVTCAALSLYLGVQMYARPPASPIQRHVTLAMAGAFAAAALARAVY